MAETPREPPSRATVLASALGGVVTVALIVLMLYRVLGGVNQAVQNAADEEREREEQVRRQVARIGFGQPPPKLPDPAQGVTDPLLAAALRDLENEDVGLRKLAVGAVARRHLAEPAAVAALVKRLRSDQEVEVRVAALRALKSVKPRTPAVEEALRDAEKDADPRVRAEAARE
jgi:hypothetical protein